MKVDDLMDCPDDDAYIYELVEGTLVRVEGSGYLASAIGVTISAALKAYVRPRRMGRVTGADGIYKFPGARTGLVPDVGFYGAQHRAQVVDRTKPVPFAPDLAVEVASPSQEQDDMDAKAALYFRGGTRLVWVVWPGDEHVDIWHPGDRQPVTLHRGDMLAGEDVIPGFRHPVDDICTDDLD